MTFLEFNGPGRHIKLELRRDARLHVFVNKEEVGSFDFEVLYDLVVEFARTTKCTRPAVRKRVALVQKLTNAQIDQIWKEAGVARPIPRARVNPNDQAPIVGLGKLLEQEGT